jgi:aminomethyltransferase
MLENSYPHVIAGPPKPSLILTPASVSTHSGHERYEVQGAGAILVPISTGDRITLCNTEGGQIAELVAADTQGRIDAGIIGLPSNSQASGLKALLAESAHRGSGLGGLRLGLERRGIEHWHWRDMARWQRQAVAFSWHRRSHQRPGDINNRNRPIYRDECLFLRRR